MKCSFSFGGLIAAICLSIFGGSSLAVEPAPVSICDPVKEEAEVAGLDRFFDSSLKEHGHYGFSRPLKMDTRKKAKDLLVQRILDKRTEFCADNLKVAEEIRIASKKAPSDSSCPSLQQSLLSATVINNSLEGYMRKVAVTFEDNRKAIELQRAEHVKALKKKLYEIATKPTGGLEGITYRGLALVSAPKTLKIEWLKKVASELGTEAHLVWGGIDGEKNPLLQKNFDFARVAVQVKREYDAAKKRKDAAAQRVAAAGCKTITDASAGLP